MIERRGSRPRVEPQKSSPSGDTQWLAFEPRQQWIGRGQYNELGSLAPRYVIMGICAARDGTVYFTTLYPFTLHAVKLQ